MARRNYAEMLLARPASTKTAIDECQATWYTSGT